MDYSRDGYFPGGMIGSSRGKRSLRCRACAAAFGTTAAIVLAFPGVANADDGVELPVDVAQAAALAVEAPVVLPAPTSVDEAVHVAAAALVAAEGPQQSSPISAGADAGAAISQVVSTVGAETISPDPSPSASAPVASQVPAAAPAATPAPPATTPTAAPVEGEEPASAEPSAAPGTAPTPDPAVVSTQYQSGNSGSINSPANSPAPTAQPPMQSPSNLDLTWTWTWTWDCGGDSQQESSVAPSNLPGDTWLWDWRWSCAADAAPSASCAGCNTAFSIRILSPGDDGPVTQTISTIAQSVASSVAETVHSAIQGVPPPPPAPPLSIPIVSPLSSPPAPPTPLAPAFVELLPLSSAIDVSGIGPVSPSTRGAAPEPVTLHQPRPAHRPSAPPPLRPRQSSSCPSQHRLLRLRPHCPWRAAPPARSGGRRRARPYEASRTGSPPACRRPSGRPPRCPSRRPPPAPAQPGELASRSSSVRSCWGLRRWPVGSGPSRRVARARRTRGGETAPGSRAASSRRAPGHSRRDQRRKRRSECPDDCLCSLSGC